MVCHVRVPTRSRSRPARCTCISPLGHGPRMGCWRSSSSLPALSASASSSPATFATRGAPGRRGGRRRRGTGRAVLRHQPRRRRRYERLGDPDRDGHRVRARRPRSRRLTAAVGAADVPADARRRRRPARDHDHRHGGRSVGSQDRRRMHPSECRSDRRGLGCGRRATNRSHRTISRHRCPVSTHEACRCQRSPETCRPQGGHSPRLPRRCDVAALAVAIARADERSRHPNRTAPQLQPPASGKSVISRGMPLPCIRPASRSSIASLPRQAGRSRVCSVTLPSASSVISSARSL